MIPLLIYTLYKRFRNQARAKRRFSGASYLSGFLVFIFVSLLVLLLSFIPKKLGAQKLQLNYTVKKGENKIGWLRIERNFDGNKSVMTLNSEIKMRAVFLLTVSAKESATFENGKMICSALYRKTNGDTKLDKQTRLVGEKYEVLENGGKENLVVPFIGNNLLSLYFQEPIGISVVYSDNYQSFISIQKTADGGYIVKFPGGSSNCFYYNGGVCTKIEISTTFYSVTVLLNT